MVRSKLLSYALIVNSLSGYWPKDYYQLNPNFGTADDLKNLVKALHDRDMCLMVDLVVNHYASWGDEDIRWLPGSELKDTAALDDWLRRQAQRPGGAAAALIELDDDSVVSISPGVFAAAAPSG